MFQLLDMRFLSMGATELEEIDTEILIGLVEERPEIWDKSVEEYKDRNKTKDAWRSVCCQLKPDFELLGDGERKAFGDRVVKRWASVRDQWTKWKRKEKEAKRSRKYIYHQQLKFLEKCFVHRPTGSNVNLLATDDHSGNSEGQQEQMSNLDRNKYAMTALLTKHSPFKSTTEKRKRDLDEFELRVFKALRKTGEQENRHMLFFKGLIPSLVSFSEEQTVDFQMGVLQLVRHIQHGFSTMPMECHQPSFYSSSQYVRVNSFRPQQSGPLRPQQYTHQILPYTPSSHSTHNFSAMPSTSFSTTSPHTPFKACVSPSNTRSTVSEDGHSPALSQFSDIDF